MRMKPKNVAAVGLGGLLCLVLAAGPQAVPAPGQIGMTRAPGWEGETYVLLGDSIFAQGCMGSAGGTYGCMCPLQAATSFTGTFLLTPVPHVPQGHHVYEVTAADWLVVFDDLEVEITGRGWYDSWTDLDGSRWQIMTLDLCLYDEEVFFTSGVVPDPNPSAALPEEIHLVLDNQAECFGYVIVLDAERQPAFSTRPNAGGTSGDTSGLQQ